MSEPHDHHFIPAFYLTRWAREDGKLIEFTRKHNKLIAKPVGPRSTGFEVDLYEARDLPEAQRQYLEKVWFQYLDRTANEALKIHMGEASQWTNELVNAWSRFVFGIHFRHPHAMPELRSAAKAIWEGSGSKFQNDWEEIKEPEHPKSFDKYLAKVDPFTAAKMQVNLIIKTFDNEELVGHMNQMVWGVIDVSTAPERFVTSDRPVCIHNLKKPDGAIFLPISPSKLFVAAEERASLDKVAAQKSIDLVRRVNAFVVGRARLYVWASDEAPGQFVETNMSIDMEPLPLFPNIDKYPA
jgi:Protein of unknown function (DUF4238)